LSAASTTEFDLHQVLSGLSFFGLSPDHLRKSVTRCTGGTAHLPSSTSAFGQYIRIITMNLPFGAGIQFSCGNTSLRQFGEA
jgi:hypothetical protein